MKNVYEVVDGKIRVLDEPVDSVVEVIVNYSEFCLDNLIHRGIIHKELSVEIGDKIILGDLAANINSEGCILTLTLSNLVWDKQEEIFKEELVPNYEKETKLFLDKVNYDLGNYFRSHCVLN